MSSLDKRAPWPCTAIRCTTVSKDGYGKEQSSPGMPLLTLCPSGADRSTISRHLPGWDLLGITPRQLMWSASAGSAAKGPSTLPSSVCKYLSTTCGCSYVGGWAVVLRGAHWDVGFMESDTEAVADTLLDILGKLPIWVLTKDCLPCRIPQWTWGRITWEAAH